MPPLEASEEGHLYRCWFPLHTNAADEAMETNLRRGHTAAGLELTTTVESAVS
jgi:hypothetical protein